MPRAISISSFRQRISELFSEAVWQGHLVEIARRRERAFLVGLAQLKRLLEPVSFQPEVIAEEGAVSIWLPELELWGRGESFAEAKADLVFEVRDYVEEYLDESERYLAAPNRAQHFPAVVRAHLADLTGNLDDVLFAAPRTEAPIREPVPA
ncbi:MAG TPA: hypothetical protein VF895_05985 [Gaiellaceae bacterium]